LLTQYTEKIRAAKFKFDLMLQRSRNLNNTFIFNNTLYNTTDAPDVPPELTAYDIFNIFNDDAVRDLGIVNRYLIRPAYEALLLQLQSSIDNSVNTFQLIYIIVFSIFFTSLTFIYLFIWRPFENNLNQTVNLCLINRFIKQKICCPLYLKRSWLHWVIFTSF
jgi:hypothetical protein